MMRLLTLPGVSELEKVPSEEIPIEMTRLLALLSALTVRSAVRPAASEARPSAKLVTAEVLADALSMRTDRIYELARQGRIPCHKVGRAVRFDIEEVRASFAHQPQTRQL